jgi:hypothetical protein
VKTGKYLVAAGAVGALVGVFVACGSDKTDGAGGFGATGSGAAGGGAAAGTADGSKEGMAGDGNLITWDAMDTQVVPTDAKFDACAADTVKAELTPASMLFVIDRTGSMNCNPPPTQTTQECSVTPQKKDTTKPSKWEIVRDSLKAAIIDLKAFQPLPAIGIMFFNKDDYCGVAAAPDVAVADLTDPQATAINQALDGIKPKGETPIVGAANSAINYFRNPPPGTTFKGNKFVVLLTDGAETCDPANKPAVITWAMGALALNNIRTFVLGAPGSEGERAFLSDIAFNGGTPGKSPCDHGGAQLDVGDCHMDMTDPKLDFKTVLAENLKKISTQALKCDFPLPKPKDGGNVNLSEVNVTYTSGASSEKLPPGTKTPCSDPANMGWQYADGNTKIVLCAGICAKVSADPAAQISIELGCPTIIPK